LVTFLIRINMENLLKSAKNIGCIGTKDDLDEIRIKTCLLIGYWIAKQNKFVHSGNAKGCDNLYATGANNVNPSLVHLYLSDNKHNSKFIVDGNILHYQEDFPDWSGIAEMYHPRYNFLPKYAQKLFNRNAGIVLASDLVIAMPSRLKSWGGGTGHGMKIAKGLGIPVINLSREEEREEIIKFILNDSDVFSL